MGIFKSAAEIVFLKPARPTIRIEGPFIRTSCLSLSLLRLKLSMAFFSAEISAENALDSFPDFFVTFSNGRSLMIDEAIVRVDRLRGVQRVSS